MNRIADYALDRELWRGNHGVFWVATAPDRLQLDEPTVVVKVLDHHATDDDFRRMVNELQVFAAVDMMQESAAGRHVLLECNSAPFFVNFERATGLDISSRLATYLAKHTEIRDG